MGYVRGDFLHCTDGLMQEEAFVSSQLILWGTESRLPIHSHRVMIDRVAAFYHFVILGWFQHQWRLDSRHDETHVKDARGESRVS